MHEGIRRVQEQMEQQGYVTDRSVATTVYLAAELHMPALIEGHAGVGKTEVAKVLAASLDTELIRLQCYEGLDAYTALYEWNYPKQMLWIRLAEQEALSLDAKELHIFSEQFLLKRPLLRAISYESKPPVLLIDEIDRADEEFEAFLLEVLSDFQVTIPELGTIRAAEPPFVVLTSNRTRELSDALKRRCLYLWIDYPSFEKELAIIKTKVPGVSEVLAAQIAMAMASLRELKLTKAPGIAESIKWAMSLVAFGCKRLEREVVEETLGTILKDREDIAEARGAWLESVSEA
ncbi:MAG TPA: MoxR family ATPase [Chloroflexota bacterium]|nr:MoxR family ATPase [Chloroflexota bacterium]